MADSQTADFPTPTEARIVRRHSLTTRLWHWTNAVVVLIMLMSGLAIFNAHPGLYWGEDGAQLENAWLVIGSENDKGYIRVGDRSMETTGVLGYWANEHGKMRKWAFPDWMILPADSNLAMARRWHLTFAWAFAVFGAYYAIWCLVSGHLRRSLTPGGREMRPGHIWRDCCDHAMLKFPCGEKARHYNVLQKLSYLAVVFLLLPAMLITGLGMSPSANASMPWILDLTGGRQSARSIHFICAALLVLFVIVHVAMVLLAGPLNHIRSMITGRFKLPKERPS